MNELKIIDQRKVLGKDFKVYGDFENPLFLAKDVAEWIDHSDTSTMLRIVDEKEKVTNIVCTPGGNQEAWFVTEDGLMEILFQSRKPIAKEFKTQVKAILKEIRKTGTYSLSPQIPQTLPEALRAYANEVENHIKAKTLLEEQKPKVLFADSVAGSNNLISVNQLSKILNQNGIEIGEKRLFVWLREHGYLCKFGDDYNLPTQRSMDLNIMEIKKSSIITGKGDTLVTRTTKITGKGCIYFVNKFLNVGKLEVI